MMKYMLALHSPAKQKSVSLRLGQFNRLAMFQNSHLLKREIPLAHLKAQKDFYFSQNKTILLLEQKLLTMKMIFKRVYSLQMMKVQ